MWTCIWFQYVGLYGTILVNVSANNFSVYSFGYFRIFSIFHSFYLFSLNFLEFPEAWWKGVVRMSIFVLLLIQQNAFTFHNWLEYLLTFFCGNFLIFPCLPKVVILVVNTWMLILLTCLWDFPMLNQFYHKTNPIFYILCIYPYKFLYFPPP